MSVKVKLKKQVSKYTRISISKNLNEAITNIQQEYPLYSVNDVISLLINKGYADWLKQNNSLNRNNNFSKYKSIKFTKSVGGEDQFTSNKELYTNYYSSKYGQ